MRILLCGERNTQRGRSGPALLCCLSWRRPPRLCLVVSGLSRHVADVPSSWNCSPLKTSFWSKESKWSRMPKRMTQLWCEGHSSDWVAVRFRTVSWRRQSVIGVWRRWCLSWGSVLPITRTSDTWENGENDSVEERLKDGVHSQYHAAQQDSQQDDFCLRWKWRPVFLLLSKYLADGFDRCSRVEMFRLCVVLFIYSAG